MSNIYENLWQVSRDVGERSEALGIFVGNVDTIALHLASKAAYGLLFTPVVVETPGIPTGESVDVNFREIVGRLATGEETRAKVTEYLKGRPVLVQAGKYSDVCLVDVSSPTAKKQAEAKELRRQAYALLSNEQRIALNLPLDRSELDPL